MSRVTWGDAGTRFFETGVDRGVLYVNNTGVAWSGLTNISENANGGEPKPYYMDGIKFLNIAGKEEFAATLECLSTPTEFGPCDGVQDVNNGLFATQQPRKAFSLSYRTLIGNDMVGQNTGFYKIHLVYNALAAPSEKAYSTNGSSTDPTSLSYSISTLPPTLTGMKPTAHFVIDTRYVPPLLLKVVEDLLYGTEAADPRIPAVSELVSIFASTSYPLFRLDQLSGNAWQILNTDVASARTVIQPTAPVVLPGEAPVLWLDTSNGGNYAVPKLVTGD